MLYTVILVISLIAELDSLPYDHIRAIITPRTSRLRRALMYRPLMIRVIGA